jgi:hypothetical protein
MLILIVLLGGLPRGLATQQTLEACPAAGDTRSSTRRALNEFKNRTVPPEPVNVDSQVTLAALLAPGDDRDRWDEHRAATVVGYVFDVRPGGIESANCHARDADQRDTHITLALDPGRGNGSERVIVEVTPRIRTLMASRGVDWSTRALRRDLLGRWVRVTGWLLFDSEHAQQSENTAPARPANWRATAWELHPVTAIAIVPRPR